jgi:DNA-binding transcriptional ArsR family regulator
MLSSELHQISTYAPNPVWSLILDQMFTEAKKGRTIVPMAALCKRLGLRMSTLQRHLTALSEHALVDVHCDEAGRWTTWLTIEGLEFCQSVEA